MTSNDSNGRRSTDINRRRSGDVKTSYNLAGQRKTMRRERAHADIETVTNGESVGDMVDRLEETQQG